MALRELHAERKKEVLFQMQLHPLPDPLNISNCKRHVLGIAKGSAFAEFTGIDAALRMNDASDNFQTAHAVIQPLVDRVAELEAELQGEAVLYAESCRALHEAEAVALEKARASLEKDPTVAKLRSQAEAVRPSHIEPTAPFRGKVELAAIPG